MFLSVTTGVKKCPPEIEYGAGSLEGKSDRFLAYLPAPLRAPSLSSRRPLADEDTIGHKTRATNRRRHPGAQT